MLNQISGYSVKLSVKNETYRLSFSQYFSNNFFAIEFFCNACNMIVPAQLNKMAASFQATDLYTQE